MEMKHAVIILIRPMGVKIFDDSRLATSPLLLPLRSGPEAGTASEGRIGGMRLAS